MEVQFFTIGLTKAGNNVAELPDARYVVGVPKEATLEPGGSRWDVQSRVYMALHDLHEMYPSEIDVVTFHTSGAGIDPDVLWCSYSEFVADHPDAEYQSSMTMLTRYANVIIADIVVECGLVSANGRFQR